MKYSRGYKVFRIFNGIFLALICIVCLYPFLNTLATSLSSNTSVLRGEIGIFPKGINFEAYTRIMKDSEFYIGYKNTVVYTVLGTLLSLTITIATAYPLSRRGLVGKKYIMLFFVFTMYFGGGMIPSFLLVKNLHIMNTIWAVILPGSLSVYNMLIMRTFFASIPESLSEAAKIDGIGDFRLLTKIILPLSKPIIATMTLFYAVGYWNDWFSALIYMSDSKKHPVTLYLRSVVMGLTKQAMSGNITGNDVAEVANKTVQGATVMLVTIPILCIYPFVQKYFVSGVMLGSVKE
ncbi:carbohydrate ABC transporter permease [Anaerosporobacter faecicola]|uniref:carbohydrate ABC transporter permease n=1 Tax=Anaerosporobacter faecicola TaxID=2718714 RepID=UPI00143A032C|nr:carbohydrate ABC transporter permease [Anaerosporobacter faecicola]